MKTIRYILYLNSLLLLVACNANHNYFPNEMEKQHVDIIRFDEALMNVNAATATEDVRVLYDEYARFMPTFMEDILGIQYDDTAYLAQALPQFLDDTVYGFRQTNQRAKELFADISPIQTTLDRAFTRIHYLYPEWSLPTIWFFISGFNASVMFMDNDIAVGVDMYLGSDYEYYNRVVYEYQKQNMRPECIAMDIVSAYLFRNVEYTSTRNRLIDNMIYRGKVLYVLSLLFPDEPDYEVMGYTREQWQWCKKNELAIWNRMMEKKDLFKTESKLLTSYLNDGPFTAEVSQNAPARLGTWVGWQITQSYMQHNPEVTIQQLLEDGDAQAILENSYYKP